MKKVISKLDGKEYYLTVCNDESNVMFICNKRYQVRNATSDDCCNPELYCVVNGTFKQENRREVENTDKKSWIAR